MKSLFVDFIAAGIALMIIEVMANRRSRRRFAVLRSIGFIILLFSFIGLVSTVLISCARAGEPLQRPTQADCDNIIFWVNQSSVEIAIDWARRHNFTERQIEQAKLCLIDPPPRPRSVLSPKDGG